MIEEIIKHAPKGATHWQAGVYYKENDYGVWSMWKGYWESSFQWPGAFMTTLPKEVSMFKVEYHEYLCHPETCCHNDHKSWWLMRDGEFYMKFDSKEEAENKKQEIATGHRIDLETLRDCDTSPNCKKFDERVK